MVFNEFYFKEENDVFPTSLVKDKVYHGSSAKFKEFDNKYIGSHATGYGMGFYFTDDKDTAKMYFDKNGKLYEAYINITKPMSEDKITFSIPKLKGFIKKLDRSGEGYLSNYGDVGYDGYERVLNTAASETYQYADNDVEILHSILNAGGINIGKFFKLVESHFGFDGIISTTEDGEVNIFVVFDKKNIKILNIDEQLTRI